MQRDFIAQTGDPTGTGEGGQSVWGVLQQHRQQQQQKQQQRQQASGAPPPPPPRGFFADELSPGLLHDRRGLVGMASSGKDANASQFYVTLGPGPYRSLDGARTLFGRVAEGQDGALARLNEAPVDGDAAAGMGSAAAEAAARPCRNVR